MKDWEEVAWCPYCGYKIVRPYQPRPYSLFGSTLQCPGGLCRKEFVVTHSILRDKDDDDGLLETLTHEGYQPRQSTLEEFQ